MAIERVAFEIRSNADEVLKQLGQIDDLLNSIRKARAEINIDTGNLGTVMNALEDVEAMIRAIDGQSPVVSPDVNVEDVEGALTYIDGQLESLGNRKTDIEIEARDIQSVEQALDRLEVGLLSLSRQEHRITVSHNLDEIGNALDNLGSKALSVLNPLSSTVGQLVSAFSISNVISAGINTISNSLDGAISRFDTLNNYPKVLQYLGYSAEQSSDSINKLSDATAGLPTPLDELVSTTQQIVGITGDLDKATNLTLALNNAFLANGASTVDATRGTTQFLRTLSNGEVDIVRWQSLAQTMPVALELIAQEFGFAEDGANQLYKALDSGTISFDEFTDKLIEVGTETGTLAEAARANATGLATSFKNIGTQITRGLTNVIDAFNETSKRLTGNTLQENLNRVRQVVIDFFAWLVPQIEKLDPIIEKGISAFGKLKTALAEFDWSSFLQGIQEGFSGLKEALQEFYDAAKPVLGWFKSLITDYGGGSFARGLGKLPALYLKIAVGLKALGSAFKIISKFGNNSLINFLTGGKKSGKSGTGLSFNIDIGRITNQLKNLVLVYGYVKVLQELAQALADINNKVPSNLGQLAPKFAAMAIALGGIVAIGAAITLLTKNVSIKTLATSLITTTALILELMLLAEALKQIDRKVPANIERIGNKLALMGAALAGIGIIATAVGGLVKIGGIGTTATAIVAITALILDLMLLAEAMKQINEKVPDDIDNVATKLASMAIAIGGFAAIVTVVGGLISTGVGALVAAGGLLTVAALAGDLILVANAIREFDENVPDDLGSVKQKIKDVSEVIQEFSKANWADLQKVVGDILGALDVAVITQGVRNLITFAREFARLEEIEISDKSVENIEAIYEALETFEQRTLDDLVSDIITTIDVATIRQSLGVLIEIGSMLEEFGNFNFDVDGITDNLKEIQAATELIFGNNSILENIGKSFTNGFDVAQYGAAADAFFYITQIADELEKIGKRTIPDDIGTQIDGIVAVLKKIGDSTLKDVIGNFISIAETELALGVLENMYLLIDPINQIGGAQLNHRVAQERIKQINLVLKEVGTGMAASWYSKFTKTKELQNAVNAINEYVNLIPVINKLGEEFLNYQVAITRIGQINQVLNAMNWGSITEVYSKWIKSEEVKQAIDLINLFANDLIPAINELAQQDIDPRASLIIEEIRVVLESIGNADFATWFQSLITLSEYAQIADSLDIFIDIVNKLNEIAEVGSGVDFGLVKRITNTVRDVLTNMQDFPELTGADTILEFIESFRMMVQELAAFAEEFEPIGENYGKNLIRGFKNAKVPQELAKIIEEAITKLKEKKEKFTKIGKDYGEALVKAFKTELLQMPVAMDSIISVLSSGGFTGRFASIGTSYGNSLVNSFRSAISWLASSVASQVSTIQTTLNNLRVPDLNVNIGSNTNTRYASEGGAAYLAGGGMAGAFQPKGTDRIPAMLTKGEYVHNADAVKMFGTDFMESVNGMDFKGTFHALSKRFTPAMTQQNYVNNVTNHHRTSNQVNNVNVTQHIKGGNFKGSSGRFMRPVGARI